jgi:hypothetical protein
LHAWFSQGAEPGEFTRSTASIHLYPGLVVFERAPREEPAVVASHEGRELSMPISAVTTLWDARA